MKTCKKCKEQKPVTEFGKDKRVKSGLTARCKSCNNSAIYAYKKQNPHLSKNLHLLSRYKITLEDKENIIAKQNGKCKICENKLDRGIHTCVDHCHTTGKVRGVLCSACNKLLGHANENQKALQTQYNIY